MAARVATGEATEIELLFFPDQGLIGPAMARIFPGYSLDLWHWAQAVKPAGTSAAPSLLLLSADVFFS